MADITSVTVIARGTRGNQRWCTCDIRGATSYSTGGDTVTAAQQGQIMGESIGTVGLSKFQDFQSQANPVATPAGLVAALDTTNNKILFYRLSATAAEVTAATNLSSQAVRCTFYYGAATGT